MSKLVIFGATGYAGSRILDEALQRGHEVIAVARDEDKIPRHENLRAVSGSMYDSNVVRELTVDADVLISAIPAGDRGEGKVLSDALPGLVDAARHNHTRLAVVGGAGSLSMPDGKQLVADVLESQVPPEVMVEVNEHRNFLDALKEAPENVNWFYLSPPMEFGAIFGGERRGTYRTGDDVVLFDDNGKSAISGEDYAIAFLDEIENPKHRRQRFTVGY